jgi:hypothetical protein
MELIPYVIYENGERREVLIPSDADPTRLWETQIYLKEEEK